VKAALAVVLLLLTLSACGQDGVGDEASAELQPQVAAVREAVAAGDRQAAAQGLALVKATVAQLNQDGKLEEAAAQSVIDSVDDVADLLLTMPEPPAPLQVPLDQLGGSVQQAPAGAQGGRDGNKGARGEDGERGRKGDNRDDDDDDDDD